ncbi:hypothetical protein [Mucilaginibacter sp. SG564]|uniref:hypothetical protein n=1 Tax=unclassified Mucilaginibacter TaxID=2617802 RepID=UPI0015553DF0|nr:hypothetical protein [Mucilaginibacter sp. SG564]NOW93570.1 hypothetical protein [Mucilaginibacter sp. SG564]
MKKAYYFFAVIGTIFSITITGCKKDQARQQTKPAMAASDNNSSLLSISSTEPPSSSSTRGCNSQFSNDIGNLSISPETAAGNYIACMLVAFPDGGTSGSGNSGIGIAHLQSVSSNSNVTLQEFFRDGNVNNPTDVAKVKAYFAPYIFLINDAYNAYNLYEAHSNFDHSELNVAKVMNALWYKHYVDQYDQYQYLAIVNAYFNGISAGGWEMRNDPLWKAVGFDQLFFVSIGPDLPVQP